MRRFTAACKDSKTGYEMILSECSYNQAMYWLEAKLKDEHMWVEQTRTRNGMVEIWPTDANFLRGRKYFYDEERGYLLGE